MGVRDAVVNLLDALDGQDVARGRTREFVGAVAGADGDGQGVDLGIPDELPWFAVTRRTAQQAAPSETV